MSQVIYFVSDSHLGVPVGDTTSLQREQLLCQFLTECQDDATDIYILGDLFDFWFEYKSVVPKGYTRILGKFAELSDRGIQLHFFIGNHDMWMFDYFEKEFGAIIYRKPIQASFFGQQYFIAHGDGMGPGDTGYKIIKKIFRSQLCQWLFARLHPNFGVGLANFLSGRSRESQAPPTFLGGEGEWLIQYCERKIKELNPVPDYLIFGHRHLPIDWKLSNNTSTYLNLGDWMRHFTYARLDTMGIQLKKYNTELAQGEIYTNRLRTKPS